MRHLDEGTIHAWLDGALNEAKARQAEEHAARCTQCAMAVADARGFIAASSRILLALDDVPGGVVGRGAGSALGARRSATAAATATTTASGRRVRGWMLKVAASIVVVAATGVLISRSGVRVPSMSRVAESKMEAPAAPAVTVAENAPAAAADKKTDALLKAKTAESTIVVGYVAKPAAEPAPAPATAPPTRQLAAVPAESARLDSNAVPVANQVAAVADRAAAGGAAKRSVVSQEVVVPSGMRMVSEKTVTAQARVVQTRVYELSPGTEVTYSIFEPARDRAEASAAPANDSGAAEKDESADSDAGVNTIKWSDPTGTDFMLSGRLPLDSLRVIRQKLTTVHRQ
jgi:hypothetical protein